MLFLGLDERRRVVGLGDDDSDPVQHFIAFAVLGALVTIAVRWNPVVLFVTLVAAGVLGEIIQLTTADRRFAIGDITMDAIGAAVGIGAVVVLSRSFVEVSVFVATAGLIIATPFVLTVIDVPMTAHPEDCRDVPASALTAPEVILEAQNLSAVEFPHRITKPSVADLRQRILATNELAVEVWFETSDLSQTGPVRVFTISTGTRSDEVNVHVGIEGDDLSVRLRTSCDIFNSVIVDDVVRADRPQHVLVTWSAGSITSWANGTKVSQVTPGWGDFVRWDANHQIIVGDEVGGGRRFDGTVYSVTMWDAALSVAEIEARAARFPR